MVPDKTKDRSSSRSRRHMGSVSKIPRSKFDVGRRKRGRKLT